MLVNLLVIFIFGMDPLLSQETGGIKQEASVFLKGDSLRMYF
jgi:hypothetical protein